MNTLIQYIEDASNNPIVEDIIQAGVVSILLGTLVYCLLSLA